ARDGEGNADREPRLRRSQAEGRGNDPAHRTLQSAHHPGFPAQQFQGRHRGDRRSGRRQPATAVRRVPHADRRRRPGKDHRAAVAADRPHPGRRRARSQRTGHRRDQFQLAAAAHRPPRLQGLDRRGVHSQGRHRRRFEVGSALPQVDFVLQKKISEKLREFLPERCVLWQEEDTRPYECDGLTAYRRLPMVVALPETEEQVQRILRTCNALGVPVVPRGAGTGLSGGALPPGDGVLLSLAKFMRVVRVDPLARIAVVQPGVRNAAISDVVAPFGLYYAPDPSSQIACSIGGNVAENSGGVHCLKYGLTVHNVLRVRGYTIEGEAVDFGSEALDAPGYDLLALAIGSEGLLAVTTEVTVKLLPEPETARVIMASFDDVQKAGDAVAAVIAAGIIPAGLEM